MAKTVKIPDNMSPWKATINGIDYVYPAGTTQEVPDEVAALIERISNVQPEKEPNMPPFAGGAQADMNAAEGEPGHVLNRTHWVEKGLVEVLPEWTFMSSAGNGQTLKTPLGLTPGKTYIVNWEGAEYKCVAYTLVLAVEAGTIFSATIIGDFSKHSQLAPATGDPFGILEYDQQELVNLYGAAVHIRPNDDTTREYTISITEINETVHKLPGKFLPDGVPYVEDLGVMEILPETEVVADGGMAMLENTISGVTAGEKYIVKYNGIEYEATAFEQTVEGVTAICLGNIGALMGNAGTGEPFAIVIVPEGVMIAAIDGATELTISIKGKVITIQKLDKRCLPNDSGFANMFTVNVSGSLDARTADKTFLEITSAVNDGNTIVRMLVETSDNTRDVLRLARYTPSAVIFSSEYTNAAYDEAIFRTVTVNSDNSINDYYKTVELGSTT